MPRSLVAAGCGGSDEVPADAVAVVDGTTITRAELDELLARAKKSYVAQKRDFPKAGTPEYQSLQTQAVAFLVQREEYAREAEKLDIEVTEAQIDKKVDEVKKQYFANDQKKLVQGARRPGLHGRGSARGHPSRSSRPRRSTTNVTKDVKVTDAAVQKYYDENKKHYTVPSRARVRHILVKTKAEADKLHAQLEGGADFAALAKKNSLDPGSKDQGGKLTVTRGQTVAPFDKAAFTLKTNELSAPIKTEFGYHLIQPLGGRQGGLRDAVRAGQGADQDAARVRAEERGRQRLGRGDAEEYEDKVQYAAGFEPPETSTGTAEETSTDGE